MADTEKLRSSITEVRKQLELVNHIMISFAACCKEDKIIVQKDIEKVASSLLCLSKLQKNLLNEYVLCFSEEEAVPEQLDQMEEKLTIYEKALEREREMTEAKLVEQRFASIYSDDEKCVALLKKHLQHLLEIGTYSKEVEEYLLKVQPYGDFYEAVLKTDYMERLGSAMQLQTYFESDLMMQLMFGSLSVKENVQAAEEEKTTSTEGTPVSKMEVIEPVPNEQPEETVEPFSQTAEDIEETAGAEEIEKQYESYGLPRGIRTGYGEVEITCGAENKPLTKSGSKNDMMLFRKGNQFCMDILRGAGLITNRIASYSYGGGASDFTCSLESLTKLGYLRKVTASGIEGFYFPSEKGERYIQKYLKKKKSVNINSEDYVLTISKDLQVNMMISRAGHAALWEAVAINRRFQYSIQDVTTMYANFTAVFFVNAKLHKKVVVWLLSVCPPDEKSISEYVENIGIVSQIPDSKPDLLLFAAETKQECEANVALLQEQEKLPERIPTYLYAVGENKWYFDETLSSSEEAAEMLRSLLEQRKPPEDTDITDDDEDGNDGSIDDDEVDSMNDNAYDTISEKTDEDAAENTAEKTTEARSETTEEAETSIRSRTSDDVSSAASVSSAELVEEEKNTVVTIPKEEFISNVYDMLLTDQIYCAVAYARTAAHGNADIWQFYQELAYACNDPAARCRYSSAEIMSSFDTEALYFPELSEYLHLCAAMRSLFLNEVQHDYQFKQLHATISSFQCLEENQPLSKLLYELVKFRDEHEQMGIDAVADYRMKDHLAYSHLLEEISRKASEDYERYVLNPVIEKCPLPRFLDTKKMILKKDSVLCTCLEIVANNDQDAAFLSYIQDFMYSNFIEHGAEIRGAAIQQKKIDSFIDDYWAQAGKRQREKHKSDNLVSSLRTNLFKMLQRFLTEIADWYYYVNASRNIVSASQYSREKMMIKGLTSEAAVICGEMINAGDCEAFRKAGNIILKYMLEEFHDRLSGMYIENGNRYFYVEFLQHSEIMLDADFLPEIEYSLAKIDGFSPAERILRHSRHAVRPYEERIEEIFNRSENGEIFSDDYGCAERLKTYLTLGCDKEWDDELNNIEENTVDARKQLRTTYENFIGTLELAQSYGQITIDHKEQILSLVDKQYHHANEETHNFGFFRRMLSYCGESIKQNARTRDVKMKETFNALNLQYKDVDDAKPLLEEMKRMLEMQNYTVAEDLVHRIENGDFSNYVSCYPDVDYLKMFIQEYEPNYKNVYNSAYQMKRLVSESHRARKDTKGGRMLIDNFPSDNSGSLHKIKEFLTVLGFKIDTVTPARYKQCYDVTLHRPVNGRKENYTHPISPFGSFAVENGFRVACLLGTYDCARLIDKFQEIGTAAHTIVLLDYALRITERRNLARKIKEELPDKIFIVVDRVALLFLASHYAENTINRMLMEICMPFGWLQPYALDAATAIPPEMFMGRKDMLLDIESPKGANIICGGRQLGKSALLRMAKNDIDHNENGDRAVYVVVKDKNYTDAARIISQELIVAGILDEGCECSDWETLCRHIRIRLSSDTKKRIPYFLLLIDEADGFLESCKAIDYAPFEQLENIQTLLGEGRFKFVIAGLRNLVQFEHERATSDNSILAHMHSRTITPFKTSEAMELLTQPLHYLGIRFPQDKQYLISLILASTNYFPGLIHYYCASLLNAMRKGDYAGYGKETPPYEITEAHIKKVLADESFHKQIKEKFIITLKLDTDNFYYMIATLVAYCCYNETTADGYTVDDIFRTASDFGISKITKLGKEKLGVLMEELRELNILRRNKAGLYLFARYNFIQLLGSKDDIDEAIIQCAEENI